MASDASPCGAAVLVSVSLQSPHPQNRPAAVLGRGCPAPLAPAAAGVRAGTWGLVAACLPGRAGAESLLGAVCRLSISAGLKWGWSDPGAAPTAGMGARAGSAGWAAGSAGTGSRPLRSAGCQQPWRRELCSLAIQSSSGPRGLWAPALPGQPRAGAGRGARWGLGWDGGGWSSHLAHLWPGGESQG